MYDIHTHLYWHSYDEDRDEVIRRAVNAGVEKMFVIGTTIEESKQAVELAEKYPELSASVGIHPHTFNETGTLNLESRIMELKNLAGSRKVKAIGECGLDYYSHDKQSSISNQQKAVQREGFLAQVYLAQDLMLPLIVHCRDAYEDVFEILKAINSQLKAVILHCYMGDTEVTKEFLRLPNVYFSFAGNITYPVKKSVLGTKDDLTETVKLVPLDRLFVETDCPFLAPQAYRGKRNEPAWVKGVAEKVAEINNTALDRVNEISTSLAQRIFGL